MPDAFHTSQGTVPASRAQLYPRRGHSQVVVGRELNIGTEYRNQLAPVTSGALQNVRDTYCTSAILAEHKKLYKAGRALRNALEIHLFLIPMSVTAIRT